MVVVEVEEGDVDVVDVEVVEGEVEDVAVVEVVEVSLEAVPQADDGPLLVEFEGSKPLFLDAGGYISP